MLLAIVDQFGPALVRPGGLHAQSGSVEVTGHHFGVTWLGVDAGSARGVCVPVSVRWWSCEGRALRRIQRGGIYLVRVHSEIAIHQC